jgi:hypothetical protein
MKATPWLERTRKATIMNTTNIFSYQNVTDIISKLVSAFRFRCSPFRSVRPLILVVLKDKIRPFVRAREPTGHELVVINNQTTKKNYANQVEAT